MQGDLFKVSVSISENGRKRPRYTLDSDLDGRMTLADMLENVKGVLIMTADQVLREEQERGFDKNPVMLVDNRRTKDIHRVHPLGQIMFTAKADLTEMLIDSFMMILKRSRVVTGRYLYSHYVFHNGNQVASDLGSLRNWLASNPEVKDKDVIRIVNIQPYARRLELLGVSSQIKNGESVRRKKIKETASRRKGNKGAVVRVPNGAYALSVRAIKRKYKNNNASIRFAFLSGGDIGLAGNFKTPGKNRTSQGRPYLYPTIVFRISERGTNV